MEIAKLATRNLRDRVLRVGFLVGLGRKGKCGWVRYY